MDTTPENTATDTQSSNPVVPVTTETPIAHEPEVTVPTALPPKVPCYKKPTHIAIFVAILLIIVAGDYYAYTNKLNVPVVAIVNGKVIFANAKNGPVVATVNGQDIYQKEYDEGRALIEQSATAQGTDLTDESAKTEIKNQALEVLINNALLITSAQKAGITVSKEDIQAKYDELVKQLGSEEELSTRMAEVGLTKEKLMSNIEERIIADKYIESVTDIKSLTVSDEEVNEFVKSMNTDGKKLPPLDQIRPQIEQQLLGQKQQQIVTDLLKKLRDQGEIEIKI
jgi:FKBP-type peptidyl-prolyl cis-trans isomerase (trigger factor)